MCGNTQSSLFDDDYRQFLNVKKSPFQQYARSKVEAKHLNESVDVLMHGDLHLTPSKSHSDVVLTSHLLEKGLFYCSVYQDLVVKDDIEVGDLRSGILPNLDALRSNEVRGNPPRGKIEVKVVAGMKIFGPDKWDSERKKLIPKSSGDGTGDDLYNDKEFFADDRTLVSQFTLEKTPDGKLELQK